MGVNRVAVHFDILQKSENDPIDILSCYSIWVYSIDMLKKYRLGRVGIFVFNHRQ